MGRDHYSKIVWNHDGSNFCEGKYSRSHIWKFDGGIEVVASSSPHVVPLPYSNANAESKVIEAMHEKAHSECFIASSVKTEVRCLPILV